MSRSGGGESLSVRHINDFNNKVYVVLVLVLDDCFVVPGLLSFCAFTRPWTRAACRTIKGFYAISDSLNSISFRGIAGSLQRTPTSAYDES